MAKQLKPIWASAEKYLEHYEKMHLEPEHYGAGNCPCCRAFRSPDCRSCPVFRYNGYYRGCRNTPYIELIAVLTRATNINEKMKAIEEEYRFLVAVALKVSEEYMSHD